MRGKNWTAALWLGVSTIAMATHVAPTAAQTRQDAQQFDIPAQAAAEALDRFVRETRFEVVYTADTVRGVRTKPVRGRMTARAALEAMLAGTGLELVDTPEGGTAIRPMQAADAAAASGTDARTSTDIVVTGTRLDERFAGASPVQVIKAETARQAGLLDTGAVLRNSPQVTGPRSQLRYNSESYGGVPLEGPGTQVIALRGLTPDQTLTLLNGRRLVSSGTEGIPRAPDIGLIPQIIVSDYQILTEGASPTYGSDAIGGIVNIKLREDFSGLTGYAIHEQPTKSGAQTLAALAYGKTSDRGYLTVAVEYRRREALRVRDAKQFGLDCSAFYSRGPDGKVRQNDVISAALPGTSASPCFTGSINRFTGILFPINGGALYYVTPNRTNAALPGFSVDTIPFGIPNQLEQLNPTPYDVNLDGVINDQDALFLDPDGDGQVGFDKKSPVYDTTRGPAADSADFIAPLEQWNVFSYGRRDTDILGDASLFFEGSFNRRTTDTRQIGANTNPTLFANGIVPITNPTNPCGVEGPGCIALAEDVDSDGNPIAVIKNGVQTGVGVFARIIGDSDRVRSETNQFRLIAGLEGNLELLNGLGPDWLGMTGWRYQVSALHSRSEGRSSRRGILKDRFALSIQSTVRDPSTGQLVCGTDTNGDGVPDPTTPAPGATRTLSDCVPVNLFAEDLLVNRRLTSLEESYLFGDLKYATNVDLTVFSGLVRGNIGRLPAGAINVVAGLEYRRDAINAFSNPAGATATTNFLTYYAPIPAGAKGSRATKEVYGEIGLPLLQDKWFAHRLNASLAGRVTNVDYVGTKSVYTVRGRWDVTDWLALRATYGTAFRSPGLAELFQNPYFVKAGIFDPCVVPLQAQSVDGRYVQTQDPRAPLTLGRCRTQGVEPTQLGLGVSSIPDVNVRQGGSISGLRPEQSKSFTAGVVANLPLARWFGSSFDQTRLNLSGTYYSIDVSNIITLGSTDIININCYLVEGAERFCDRVKRGSDGFISDLDLDFVNVDGIANSGIDFNLLFQQGFRVGSKSFEFSLDVSGNYELKNDYVAFSFGGITSQTRRSGFDAYPKLKIFTTAQLRQNDVTLTWYANYVDGTKIRNSLLPEQNFACAATEQDRCSFIRNINSYIVNNTSVTWQPGTWALSLGVNNVFDVAPPRVGALGPDASITNTLLSGNYDLYGRSVVFQIRKQF